LVPVGIRYRR